MGHPPLLILHRVEYISGLAEHLPVDDVADELLLLVVEYPRHGHRLVDPLLAAAQDSLQLGPVVVP